MSDVAMLHTPRQLVIFRVGETNYGLDIDTVSEILGLLPITAVAGAPNGILGMAEVRKRVVPVFDLHWKFGLPKPVADKETRMILVEVAEGPVALLVDGVHEVVTVPREAYQPVHTPGSTDGLGYLSGVVRLETGLVLWVDHKRLVPSGVVKRANKRAA